MDDKLLQLRSERIERDGYEMKVSVGFEGENILRGICGEQNHRLDLVRAETLKRCDLIGAREFRLDSKLVEDEVRSQIAAASGSADVDFTPIEVMNGRDITPGQDVQALARSPEKVAKVPTRALPHRTRQGLDGVCRNERDIDAGIVEETEKILLWPQALSHPETKPGALKGSGKIGDETVIGAFIRICEDRD